MHNTCQVCGAMLEPEPCGFCGGAGGWHDCGEDTCNCLDPDELNDFCTDCDGEGEWLRCPAVPHTEEQKQAYRARVTQPPAPQDATGGEA